MTPGGSIFHQSGFVRCGAAYCFLPNVNAQLYIETTNGIEIVWRVSIYDWLLLKRVAAYATAVRLLFRLPWGPNSAFLSLIGRTVYACADPGRSGPPAALPHPSYG